VYLILREQAKDCGSADFEFVGNQFVQYGGKRRHISARSELDCGLNQCLVCGADQPGGFLFLLHTDKHSSFAV
jgi:hypothetical protein